MRALSGGLCDRAQTTAGVADGVASGTCTGQALKSGVREGVTFMLTFCTMGTDWIGQRQISGA